MKKQVLTLLSLTVIPALITGCCSDIQVGKETADVSPLYELDLQLDNVQKLSEIIDVKVFDDLSMETDTVFSGSIYNKGRVDTSMYLEGDAQIANKEFLSECNYIPRVTIGGGENSRYCMSQIVELRSSVESLCRPTGEYNSKIVFLKDRLIISIVRYTGNAKSPELEAVILKIARALEK